MLEGLDKIDWNSIHHCYGVASDIPEKLNSLLMSQTKEEFKPCLWDLDNLIAHQSDISDAIPFVIPFLGQILLQPSLPKYIYEGIDDSLGYYSAQAYMWLQLLESEEFGPAWIQERLGYSPDRLKALVEAINSEYEKILKRNQSS